MNPERENVLVVDDDEALLVALVRCHRKHFRITSKTEPEAGLWTLEHEGPFAVVVTDFNMPGMNGTQFLTRAQEIAPDAVRIMLTGRADLHTAMDAINRGQIFRLLTKPCETDIFRKCVADGVEQHRLRTAEKQLLEHTVRGSIQVLTEVLSLANPSAFGRSTRVSGHVRHIARKLRVRDAWQYETAALLCQIGCISIPNNILDKIASGETLTPHQEALMEKHPLVAHDLLSKIPRLHVVAEIVCHQRMERAQNAEIDPVVRLGARILAAALDFEEYLSLGARPTDAIEAMSRSRQKYGSRVLEALATMEVSASASSVRLLPVSLLQAGMVLLEDIRNEDGNLIVCEGHEIRTGSLQRLQNYADLHLLPKSEYRVRLSCGANEAEAA